MMLFSKQLSNTMATASVSVAINAPSNDNEKPNAPSKAGKVVDTQLDFSFMNLLTMQGMCRRFNCYR